MANYSELKKDNTLRIVRALQSSGQATKPDIARHVGLTTVAVHKLIGELIQKGICVPSGISESTGGRKAVYYKLNGSYGYAIGVRISRGGLDTVVLDLCFNEIYHHSTKCVPGHVEETVELIRCELDKVLSLENLRAKRCLGVGVAIPGRADATGTVIHIPAIPNWENYSLRSQIEKRINLKTFVDNDSNAMILAAKWYGLVDDSADAIYLTITEGFGAGIISKGKLFYGSSYHACEIGHTLIGLDGPVCSCGNKGCIEAVTCESAILASCYYTMASKYAHLMQPSLSIRDIALLTKTNSDGDLYAAFGTAAHYIAIAVHNLVSTFDPNMVIIQSNWLDVFPELVDGIRKSVFAGCRWKNHGNLQILINPDKPSVHASPAFLVFDEVFGGKQDF